MNNMMYPDGQHVGVPQARPQVAQPTHAVHAVHTQPAQAVAMHAYEPQVAQIAPQPQNHTINFRVDEDAKNVLEQITPELREAFVTIAIKHFQYDPMFQHYFKKVLPQEVEIGTGVPITSAPAPAGVPTGPRPGIAQVAQPAAQPAVTGGFDDW